MRKKFFVAVLIPVLIISLIVYFFIDGWIESGIEYAGEKAVGAKVEINSLHVHLFPLGMDWQGIQVANPRDPWKNLFQTDKVIFSMDPWQLLRGKVIIETAEVHNLLIGTKRKTNGSLPPGDKNKSASGNSQNTFSKLADNALKQVVTATPVFDISKLKKGFKPDSLLKSFDFKTIKHIDTLKTQAENTYKEWALVKAEFENSKNKLQDVQNKLKAINPSSLNNIANITSAISTVDNAVKTVNEIQGSFKKRSVSITDNIKNLTASVDSIDDFAKQDFQKLKSMAKLPSINSPAIASLLVGNEMYNTVNKYMYWVDFARNNIKKYQPEPEYTKPPRMKGENISFPVKKGYPKFWIKKIIISGGTSSDNSNGVIALKGTAAGITSNQSITGVPLTINLEGTSSKRQLKLSGLFDRRKDVPFDEYTLNLSGVPVGQFELGKSDFLPTKVTDAYVNTSLKITVPGNNFDSNLNFKFANANFEFKSQPRNIGERVVREVLSGLHSFYVNLRLWNTKGSYDVALSTDLDKQISNKLMEVVGAEFSKLQNDLKVKFDSFISQQKKNFMDKYNGQIENIKKQIDSYNSLISDNLAMIDSKKKELTDKLEKQKSGILDNKLKDLLKK